MSIEDVYAVLLDGICEGFVVGRGTYASFVRFWSFEVGGVFLRVSDGMVRIWWWMGMGDVWCCPIEDPGVVEKARAELVRRGVALRG